MLLFIFEKVSKVKKMTITFRSGRRGDDISFFSDFKKTREIRVPLTQSFRGFWIIHCLRNSILLVHALLYFKSWIFVMIKVSSTKSFFAAISNYVSRKTFKKIQKVESTSLQSNFKRLVNIRS